MPFESTASEHNKQGLQQTQEQDASERVRLSEAANKQPNQPSSSRKLPQARVPLGDSDHRRPRPRVRALVLVSATCSGATRLVWCWHVASLAALCDSEPLKYSRPRLSMSRLWSGGRHSASSNHIEIDPAIVDSMVCLHSSQRASEPA